jgi:mTERF domain-containing protein
MEYVGFSIFQTQEVLVRTPQLLTLSVDYHLKPKLSFFHQELQMPKESIKRLIQKHPNIFATHSLEKNIRPKLIGLFSRRLLFEPVHLSKMLNLYPQILDRSLSDYLLPLAQYFLKNLMFSPLELRTILTQFPRLSSYSLGRIKHIEAYLRDEEGFTAEQVKRIFFQAPQIVCLKEEHLKEKIKFVCDALQLHHKNDDRLRKIISGMPSLLKCSLKGNLTPKLEYLHQAFNNSLDEVRDAILLQPTMLGYSLVKRIRPRMEKILKSGLQPKKITIAITLREDRFESWLESQNMSRDEKVMYKQTRRSLAFRNGGIKEKAPMHGKQIVDEKGKIILWNRPLPNM